MVYFLGKVLVFLGTLLCLLGTGRTVNHGNFKQFQAVFEKVVAADWSPISFTKES